MLIVVIKKRWVFIINQRKLSISKKLVNKYLNSINFQNQQNSQKWNYIWPCSWAFSSGRKIYTFSWGRKIYTFYEIFIFNPIPAGQFDPPSPSFFLHNTFCDFSNMPKALHLGLKPGFNTNCLSPQADCLNDCFCL